MMIMVINRSLSMSGLYFFIRFCKSFWWQKDILRFALSLLSVLVLNSDDATSVIAAESEPVVVTKEGRFGKLGKYIKKASEETAAIVKGLRQFVRCFSHVEEFKIRPSRDKKLALYMKRSQASQIRLDKVEKFGVKVKSLDFDKDIKMLAGRDSTGLALRDIQGIKASVSVGQMVTQVSVNSAALEMKPDGTLLFKTEITHKAIPVPIPLAVPLAVPLTKCK